jgi:magnesium transporter
MDKKFKQEELNSENHDLLTKSLWIDLINPTWEDEVLVEKTLGLNIPTREEMQEIEISSRLYKESDVLFMTATMIAQSETSAPKQEAVTFVLTPKQLITIRYIEPQAFKLFASIVPKLEVNTSSSFLTELLDTAIDRFADILEMIGRELDIYSKNVFQSKNPNNTRYHNLLQQLGVNGELNSKIAESLVSFNRLISFFDQSLGSTVANEHFRLMTLSRDITSLTDHVGFLSNKTSFLLEATLGMVQIEQNAIIKIFSVAAAIFLPPTLIASIYGMNFHAMPELSWRYGYIFAVGLMLLSSWVPYKYFKYRKWL